MNKESITEYFSLFRQEVARQVHPARMLTVSVVIGAALITGYDYLGAHETDHVVEVLHEAHGDPTVIAAQQREAARQHVNVRTDLEIDSSMTAIILGTSAIRAGGRLRRRQSNDSAP